MQLSCVKNNCRKQKLPTQHENSILTTQTAESDSKPLEKCIKNDGVIDRLNGNKTHQPSKSNIADDLIREIERSMAETKKSISVSSDKSKKKKKKRSIEECKVVKMPWQLNSPIKMKVKVSSIDKKNPSMMQSPSLRDICENLQ